MQSNARRVLAVLAMFALASILVACGETVTVFIQAPTPTPNECLKTAYFDGFQGPVDPQWSLIDPGGDATYSVFNLGKYFTITAPAGNDLYPGNTRAPRLLRPLSGDFTVETLVAFDPAPPGYKGAGILIWQDENNFLRLERGYNSRSGIEFDKNANGVYSRPMESAQVPTTSRVVGLRLKRQGDHFTAYWRDVPSGGGWLLVGNADLRLAGVKAGLIVVNAPSNNATAVADFDYFAASCS